MTERGKDENDWNAAAAVAAAVVAAANGGDLAENLDCRFEFLLPQPVLLRRKFAAAAEAAAAAVVTYRRLRGSRVDRVLEKQRNSASRSPRKSEDGED